MEKEAYYILSPFWARITAKTPRLFWRLIYGPIGFLFFLRAIAYRGHTLTIKCIKESCSAGKKESSIIFLSSLIAGAKAQIELAWILQQKNEKIREWASKHITYEGTEHINRSLEKNKPVILLLTSFSLHYHGLLAPERLKIGDRQISIVQPIAALSPLRKVGFYEKISKISGNYIKGIMADTPTAPFQIVRALKKNSIIAMRIDSMPTKTSNILISELLGRKSAFPLSILMIAARCNADLIPFHVWENDNSYTTTFGKAINLGGSPSEKDYIDAAEKIDSHIGNAIKKYPHQYSAWYAIFEKWRMAEEIQHQLHTVDMDNRVA
ncbi:LpxL/LpxP family acyltransferase [Microbulbifer sp. TRSA007]|uniref:LpxL/LpxP family acyltransferase n=1 Tax=Microbulbifer sp. TRSA007 TaxID=3243384 RepID=UPI004039E0E0